MIDLTIILGVGVVLVLYLLVLWYYVYTNREKEKIFAKELVELSVEMSKLRNLIKEKDKEIEELKEK